MNDPNKKKMTEITSPSKVRVRRRKEVKVEPVEKIEELIISEEIKESEFNNNFSVEPEKTNKTEKNMSTKKTVIVTALISLILGAVIALSAYFIYIVVKMQNQVNQNTSTISQIVNFLNSNIQGQQNTTPTSSSSKAK